MLAQRVAARMAEGELVEYALAVIGLGRQADVREPDPRKIALRDLPAALRPKLARWGSFTLRHRRPEIPSIRKLPPTMSW